MESLKQELIIKQIITDWTKKYAKAIANVEDVKVEFSTRMSRVLAYAMKRRQLIKYNLKWLIANKHQLENVKTVIVHECCHLVHANHSPAFKKLCRRWGLRGDSCNMSSTHSHLESQPHKYQATCPACGHVHKRHRRKNTKSSCGRCSNTYNDETRLIYVEVRYI